MTGDTLRHKIRARRDMPTPATFRALREEAGLTQADIAVEVGVSPMSISHYERGLRRPRGEQRNRYLRVIDVLKEEMA